MLVNQKNLHIISFVYQGFEWLQNLKNIITNKLKVDGNHSIITRPKKYTLTNKLKVDGNQKIYSSKKCNYFL